MLIEPGVHLVASGALGCDLTDAYDAHVWVFTGTAGNLIVDASAGRTVDALLTAGTAGGLDWARPTWLLLTHGHADHSGGAAVLRGRLSARLHAGPLTAKWLAASDETAISLPPARRAGVYPADYRWTPCPADAVVEDGTELAFGDLVVRPIATPGHSADHVAYLVRRGARSWLLAGDTLFHGGHIVLQDTWDCDSQAHATSLRRLADLEFDALLPGHGLFSLSGARRHLDMALGWLDRLLLPPQLG